MGLSVVVGVLSELDEEDTESRDYYRQCFRHINDLLAENGLPPHSEPESLPYLRNRCALDGFLYTSLHRVRRAYAHRFVDPSWTLAGTTVETDEVDAIVNEVTMQMTSHLLCHSDAEGFYLPIDFTPVLFPESGKIPGDMVGSSYRLLEELIFVAPALGIRLDGNQLPDSEADAINSDLDETTGGGIERVVWLSLFDAAQLSIEHGAAIWFT